jgi:phage gp36-like protein
MLYSTVEEWITRYPRLQETEANSATLHGFLDEASSEADGYLTAAGITVPVSPAPPVLVGKVQVLALTFFFERSVKDAGADPGVENMRTHVLEWFQKLIDGDAALALEEGNVTVWSNLDQYTPTFGAGDIWDARVDPDRKTDEEDAR